MSATPKHTHHGHAAEKLGFTCRWLLLGGSAALVVAVAWQGLLATVALGQAISCRFVALDIVNPTTQDPRCNQPALILNSSFEIGLPAGLAARPTGPLRFGPAEPDQTFWIRWPNCQAGQAPAEIIGAPYSSLAFQRQTASVLGVPAGRNLTLVDARLMPKNPNAPTPVAAAWRKILDDAAKTGDVALLCPGTVEQFEAFEARYRRAGGKLVVLYRPGGLDYILPRLAIDLRRPKRQGLSVVTADGETAALAGRQRYRVDLVAGPADANALP